MTSVKLILASTVLVLLFSLSACEKPQEETTAIIKPVKTMVLGQTKSKAIRSFPGKVKATKEATLAFQVPGELIELPILKGTKVKKGSLLARLDPKKFQDRVNANEAKYNLAKAEYERAAQLVKKNYISEAQFDDKKSAMLVAKSNFDTAKLRFSYTYLYAPFDGYVANRYVENHEHIKVSRPIVLLQDISVIDIEIQVPENIMINIKEEQQSKPIVVFESAPHKSYPVKFKEFSSEADPETQTYTVIFKLPAPQDINVLPGMTATIRAHIPDFTTQANEFYVVPSSAVFANEKNQSSVWVVDPKTMTVVPRAVSVTRLSNKNIRITSGLNPGDRIVTAGVHFLKKGEKIRLADPVKGVQ